MVIVQIFFIIRLDETRTPFKENVFRGRLEKLGNSIVVVQDEDIVKVHVHTLTPGDALNLAQKHGEFIKLKIENMTETINIMKLSVKVLHKLSQ